MRFGTPADVGTRILPGLLALFARSHPGVEVDVSVARSIDMIERIDAGELDLALITPAISAGRFAGRADPQRTLVWAGRSGGVAALRTPLPLALASRTAPGDGRPWTRSTESGAATASPTRASRPPARKRR